MKASEQKTRTKVKTAEEKVLKFKYISYENGVFYGVNEKNGKPMKTSLFNENVVGVNTINNSASALTTLATFIGIPVFALLGLFIIVSSDG